MDGIITAARQERFTQLDFGAARKCDLRALDRVHEPRFGTWIRLDALAIVAHAIEHPLEQRLIDVVAAKMGVSVTGFDLEKTFVALEDRYIEGAATKVIHQHVGFTTSLVAHSRSRRFVHQALHLESGELPRQSRCLTLSIVEIGRNRDDRATGS